MLQIVNFDYKLVNVQDVMYFSYGITFSKNERELLRLLTLDLNKKSKAILGVQILVVLTENWMANSCNHIQVWVSNMGGSRPHAVTRASTGWFKALNLEPDSLLWVCEELRFLTWMLKLVAWIELIFPPLLSACLLHLWKQFPSSFLFSNFFTFWKWSRIR